MNGSLRVVSTGVYEGRVDADAAAAFAMATNDLNPRYLDGRSVPPLFTASLVADAEHEVQELSGVRNAVVGFTGSVHAQHDVRFWGEVLPEMRLRWTASTYCARRKSTGVVVVDRILVDDEAGNRLAEHYWSVFYIKGTTDADIGPDPDDHSFPVAARGNPVAVHGVRVDRDQAFRYAGVSGDHVGHAMDDEVARSEGYAGKILQGMCSFGLVCGPLVDSLADGDPRRLSRLSIRFSAPAYPVRQMELRTYAAGITDGGGPAFAFETEQAGSMVHTHGRVELHH